MSWKPSYRYHLSQSLPVVDVDFINPTYQYLNQRIYCFMYGVVEWLILQKVCTHVQSVCQTEINWGLAVPVLNNSFLTVVFSVLTTSWCDYLRFVLLRSHSYRTMVSSSNPITQWAKGVMAEQRKNDDYLFNESLAV